MEDRFALLIDADNVSAKYIKPILDELSKYGNVTYKRIYGDWTKTNNASWKEELLQNSITPIQQFSYTHGKNATDSAMIIDAMDMLYTSELEGFCLVSSDSDFTKLASRLRESGKTVIGMGEGKTPSPFRKACDIFTELELLLEDNTMGKEERNTHSHASGKWQKKDNHDSMVSKEKIEEAVVKIITENQNNDRETGLGEVGSRLVKLYPDFDVRRYGYSLLSKFLETLPRLMLIQEGTKVSVALNEDKSRKEMVEEYIQKIYEELLKEKQNSAKRISDLQIHLKETQAMIHLLEETNDPNYESFTPRKVNSRNKQKIDELHAEMKELEEAIQHETDYHTQQMERVEEAAKVLRQAEADVAYRCDRNTLEEERYHTSLLETQENERQRISRELHDSTVQNLTAMVTWQNCAVNWWIWIRSGVSWNSVR